MIRFKYNNVKSNPVIGCLFSNFFISEKIYALRNDPDSFYLHTIVLVKILLCHILAFKRLQTFIFTAK